MQFRVIKEEGWACPTYKVHQAQDVSCPYGRRCQATSIRPGWGVRQRESRETVMCPKAAEKIFMKVTTSQFTFLTHRCSVWEDVRGDQNSPQDQFAQIAYTY